jgi:hypothetical protein
LTFGVPARPCFVCAAAGTTADSKGDEVLAADVQEQQVAVVLLVMLLRSSKNLQQGAKRAVSKWHASVGGMAVEQQQLLC